MFTVELNLMNCTCSISAGEYESGDYHFILIANEGFDFVNTIPQIKYFSTKGSQFSSDFNYVNDTTYEFSDTIDDKISSVEIIGIASPISSIKNKYGIIEIYNPTIEELKSIAKTRYFTYFITNTQDNEISKFVVSLFKIYCDVPSIYKGTIYFGKYDLKIESNIVSTDIINLDCGTIQINEKYNNSLDYDKTSIQIYAPFIGFIDIPTSDTMNKIIGLTYKINIVNGDSLAIISVDNKPLMTKDCNIAFKFPYTMENLNKVNSEIDSNNYFDLQPFLYIRRPILSNNELSLTTYNKTNIFDIIGNYHGYTIVTDIQMTFIHDFVTFNEIEEIKSLLATGVIL